MNPLHRLAERKIEEAVREGLFDNLPGRGRPLVLEDLSRVPPELRAPGLGTPRSRSRCAVRS
jgi:hypothetical protein